MAKQITLGSNWDRLVIVTAESHIKNRYGQESIDVQRFPRIGDSKVGDTFKHGMRWYTIMAIDEVLAPHKSVNAGCRFSQQLDDEEV